jgi:integrase
MAQSRSRGQIIPKGKDRWLVRIFLGRGADGKRRYANQVVEGNKTKAQKYLIGKLREQDLGIFVEGSGQLVREHMEEWLSIVRNRVTPQTWESYSKLANKHLLPHLGEKKLTDVKMHHVQEVVDSLSAANLSPRTVQYVRAVMSMAFRRAIEQNKLLRNPCEFVVLPKQVKKEKKVLSPDQAKRFLQEARGHRHGIIFEFALVTGMRPEEYLALGWSDIDFETGTARVRRVLIWEKGGGHRFDAPKTPKSRRSVPLPENLIVSLRSHRIEQLEARMKLGGLYHDPELVFANELGAPIHSRNLAQRSFTKILKAIGLEKVGFVLFPPTLLRDAAARGRGEPEGGSGTARAHYRADDAGHLHACPSGHAEVCF